MDVNKIVSFRNNLNDTIRSRLQNQLNLPTTYPEYLRTIQQLASKIAAPLYVQAPKITYDPIDLNELDELIIGAFTTTPPNPPSPLSLNLSNPPISPKILARSITLELHDEYRQNGRCIRYGSKDHWIRNCSLALHNTLAGTIPGRQVTVVAVNDDDYNDSDGFELSSSYDGTRSELEAKVDAMAAERSEID